jgi:NTE family protein
MLVDGGIMNPIPVDVTRALGADLVIAITVLDVAIEPADEKPPESVQEIAAQWLARLFPGDAVRANGVTASEPDPPAAIDRLGLIEIMSRSSRIVQARLAEHRLRSDPPDVMVRIPLPKLSLFEFDRSSEAVLAGRQAAVASLPAIRAAIEKAESIAGRMSRMLRAPTR